MNNEELTILIERYLDGELSEQEKQQFEQDIKVNKELADELMLHEAIRSAIGDEELIDLREKLNVIRHEYHEKEAAKKRKKQISIYSFGIIFTAILTSTFFFYEKSYTNDELFSMYYEHYDAGTIMRGEVKPAKDIYEEALRTFDLRKYADAIKLFEQIADTSEYYLSKEYFTGLSYMELKNYNEAIKHLETAQNDKQNIYHESTIWYCGLCYLKTNQIEKAKQKFQFLNNSCPLYQKKSKEILKKIQ